MNFRYRLMQFMSGRYGVDTTFYVIFILSSILAVLNCFLHLWALQIVVYALTFYAIFRMLSRNIRARSNENKVITGWIFKLRNNLAVRKSRRADFSHIYKKCPNCKATLRLPRKKGKHKTVCPKCSTEFSVRVHRGI